MTNPDVYGVYGYSGFGREVMPLARAQLKRRGEPFELVFIDDKASEGLVVNGQPVVTYAAFLRLPAARKFCSIAIADSRVRETLAARCAGDGIEPFEIRAGNVMDLDENRIGPGAILCGFSHVTSNAVIGRHFHANIYSYVAHDCVVGDFVTLAPGAKINGNVVLEDHTYVGTGAVIKQGSPGKPTVIGKGAVVGMGAVVTRSVAPGVTVVGNPARELDR